MIKEVYHSANQPLPEYQQLEDIFKFIDIRKDGQLDFQEFTQIFRTCNPPSLLMGTTPAQSGQLSFKLKADREQSLPTKQKSIPLFKHSPAYQQFINLLSRNRKFILEEIEKLNITKNAYISFEGVERIIREFVGRHSIKVDSSMVRNLIAFSMTGEKVDYHLLVSKLKDLSVEMSEFPKRRIF